MAKCQLTGKGRTMGHKVSHSNIKTNRPRHPNVQKRRVYDPVSKRSLTVYLTTRALRTLDKIGLAAFVRKHGIDDPKVKKAFGF